MDNLKRLSDKKRADIDLHRALSDYNETIKTINFEVQDALLNYQKALLQLNTAEAEMKFRRNEVEITKTRSMVADASLSNTMESPFQFSEAQSRYMRALANYRLTLTNLKKACGYGIEI
jgi:outer membrane protein TolC